MTRESDRAIDALGSLLRQAKAGDGMSFGEVAHLRPLSGGSINRVYAVKLTSEKMVVFKWHSNPPGGFFAAEQDGLRALAESRALKVPQVYAAGEHGIVMEWLGPPPADSPHAASDPGTTLGIGLARQHRVEGQAHGWHHDNFVGLLPQVNSWTERWSAFYAQHRLQPQFELAERLGRMTTQRRRWADRLLARLTDWIDDTAVRPALLHGDLWAGNWLLSSEGPALIDPAVYYGDREMDLAMARLFGGFPPSFYRAYQEAYPLAAGHEERLPLYQLYYLLIHLNIFGESYGSQVDEVLRRYGA